MLAPLHADRHVDQSGLARLLRQRFRSDVEHRHNIALLTEITASTEASAQPASSAVPSRSCTTPAAPAAAHRAVAIRVTS